MWTQAPQPPPPTAAEVPAHPGSHCLGSCTLGRDQARGWAMECGLSCFRTSRPHEMPSGASTQPRALFGGGELGLAGCLLSLCLEIWALCACRLLSLRFEQLSRQPLFW